MTEPAIRTVGAVARMVLAASMAFAAVTGPASADAKAGRQIAEEQCQSCHGIDGVAIIEEAPNLAGQKRSYLANQLWAFRSGERNDPKMSPVALGLSDEAIVDVIDWYSSIAVSVEMPGQ